MTKQNPDKLCPKCNQETDFPFGPIPHWISVKDRLPNPEENVLVCAYGDIYIGFYKDQTWRNTNWSALHVTHWMPPPPPPEKE